MTGEQKTIFEEYPIAIVFAIGGLLLAVKIFDNFWAYAIGVIIGGFIGLTIDGKRNSK